MQHLMEDSAIDLAVKGLRNGKYESVPEVATAYGLHRSTLYRRLKNQATLKEARVAQQILTPAQEEWVVRVIESLQRVHVVVTNDMVLAIVACVAQPHTGRQWLQRFYRRQTGLLRIDGSARNPYRRAAAIEFTLVELFDELQARCDQYNISPCDLYDMNEIGFEHNRPPSGSLVFDKRDRPCFGNTSRWTYTVESSSADGRMLEPMIVHHGEDPGRDHLVDEIYNDHSTWEFALSTEVWKDNRLGLRWLQKCFIPRAGARRKGEHILLILDNHPSHRIGEFIYDCYVDQIIPIYVPLHCDYLLQPLDLGPWSSARNWYKRYWAQHSSPNGNETDRAQFVRLYTRARQELFTQQSIQARWQQSGTRSFNRGEILAHPAAADTADYETQQQ